jgi:hypothetical protein
MVLGNPYHGDRTYKQIGETMNARIMLGLTILPILLLGCGKDSSDERRSGSNIITSVELVFLSPTTLTGSPVLPEMLVEAPTWRVVLHVSDAQGYPRLGEFLSILQRPQGAPSIEGTLVSYRYGLVAKNLFGEEIVTVFLPETGELVLRNGAPSTLPDGADRMIRELCHEVDLVLGQKIDSLPDKGS